MKKTLQILLLCLSFSIPIGAQTLAHFHIPDTFQIRGSLQGLAIHDKFAFLLRDGGQCIILDLERHHCCGAFQLDSNNTHCNNASFSNQYYDPSDPFPLLYVSSCYSDKSCLVYRIDTLGSTLIQRIVFDSPRFPVAQDWCLDATQSHIYAYGGRRGETMHLLQFNLPPFSSSFVTLTDHDVLHDTPLQCVNIAQGSYILDGLAYLPDGIPGQASLHIIDMKTGMELQNISFNHLTLNPEGISILSPFIYITFHSQNPLDNLILAIPIPK